MRLVAIISRRLCLRAGFTVSRRTSEIGIRLPRRQPAAYLMTTFAHALSQVAIGTIALSLLIVAIISALACLARRVARCEFNRPMPGGDSLAF